MAVAGFACFSDPVTDLHTERLVMHAVDATEAERIVARQPGPDDLWTEDGTAYWSALLAVGVSPDCVALFEGTLQPLACRCESVLVGRWGVP